MATVNKDHAAKDTYKTTGPKYVPFVKPALKTIFHKTSDNSTKIKTKHYLFVNEETEGISNL